jgi:hypothetical protein
VTLVDTSVWVEHLRRGHPGLAARLEEGQVATHPFVIGELACGHLRNRREALDLLRALPRADVAQHDEVMLFVERHRLMGSGLGWVDVHLLASAVLEGIPLWTMDARLRGVAARVGLGTA